MKHSSFFKKSILCLAFGVLASTAFIACDGSDSSTESDYSKDDSPSDVTSRSDVSRDDSQSATTQSMDFYTTPCNEMGGSVNANGACIIPCETDNDCAEIKGASKCTKGGTWRIAGYCEPETCDQKGWHMGLTVCYISCNETGDRTENCLAGTECSVIPNKEGFCSGNVSESSSSTVTTSPSNGGSGGVCDGCGGLFCSGRCVGCPGC